MNIDIHHCKRCGREIPYRVRGPGVVVYLGTVGRHAPDVEPEREGLCLPCLADEAPTIPEALSSMTGSIQRLSAAMNAVDE